jgi:hypothetical protein
MKKLLFLGFMVSACGNYTNTDQVRIRAANDLRCDAAQVQTTQVDDLTVRANGCGQERTYSKECVGNSTRCNWRGHGEATAEKPAATSAQ